MKTADEILKEYFLLRITLASKDEQKFYEQLRVYEMYAKGLITADECIHLLSRP